MPLPAGAESVGGMQAPLEELQLNSSPPEFAMTAQQLLTVTNKPRGTRKRRSPAQSADQPAEAGPVQDVPAQLPVAVPKKPRGLRRRVLKGSASPSADVQAEEGSAPDAGISHELEARKSPCTAAGALPGAVTHEQAAWPEQAIDPALQGLVRPAMPDASCNTGKHFTDKQELNHAQAGGPAAVGTSQQLQSSPKMAKSGAQQQVFEAAAAAAETHPAGKAASMSRKIPSTIHPAAASGRMLDSGHRLLRGAAFSLPGGNPLCSSQDQDAADAAKQVPQQAAERSSRGLQSSPAVPEPMDNASQEGHHEAGSAPSSQMPCGVEHAGADPSSNNSSAGRADAADANNVVPLCVEPAHNQQRVPDMHASAAGDAGGHAGSADMPRADRQAVGSLDSTPARADSLAAAPEASPAGRSGCSNAEAAQRRSSRSAAGKRSRPIFEEELASPSKRKRPASKGSA